jgi:hypothetical protein
MRRFRSERGVDTGLVGRPNAGRSTNTINGTVMAYGTALLEDDADRIGTLTAVGLDETLFVRRDRGTAKSSPRRS